MNLPPKTHTDSLERLDSRCAAAPGRELQSKGPGGWGGLAYWRGCPGKVDQSWTGRMMRVSLKDGNSEEGMALLMRYKLNHDTERGLGRDVWRQVDSSSLQKSSREEAWRVRLDPLMQGTKCPAGSFEWDPGGINDWESGKGLL